MCKGPKSRESNMIDGIARYLMFKTIDLIEEILMQVLSHSRCLEIEISVKEPYKVKSKKYYFSNINI